MAVLFYLNLMLQILCIVIVHIQYINNVQIQYSNNVHIQLLATFEKKL
jgi:hypothetical protein